MRPIKRPIVAIIDYGLGNLFSIQKACEHVGLPAIITSDEKQIMGADCVILPGVGAFGDAMDALIRLNLVVPIREFVASDKPVLGICLGLQLLFSRSYEFGTHRGLDIIQGEVVRLPNSQHSQSALKVPHVGWNRTYLPDKRQIATEDKGCPELWHDTLLEGIENGAFMYFVHSYYVVPQDSSQTLTETDYGETQFCSGVKKGNIYGFQFHPERSGPTGLMIYQNLYTLIKKR
jgi:glutamine amidotransferase